MNELTQIDGIGPATAKQLVARGITSLQHLALCDLSVIEDIRGASEDWITQAQALLDIQAQDEAVSPIETVDVVFTVTGDTTVNATYYALTIFLTDGEKSRIETLRDTLSARNHLPDLTLEGTVRMCLTTVLQSIGEAGL